MAFRSAVVAVVAVVVPAIIMSSSDEERAGTSSKKKELKKKTIPRACDVCRRKKARCDASQMPGNRCSNCITYNVDCTFVEAAKKRGHTRAYVQGLESRLSQMETLFKQVFSGADSGISQRSQSDLIQATQSKPSSSSTPSDPGSVPAGGFGPGAMPHFLTDLPEPSEDEDEGPAQIDELALSFGEMHVTRRFIGKSSDINLMNSLLKNTPRPSELDEEHTPPREGPVIQKLQEYTPPEPWESVEPDPTPYMFPDAGLLIQLIDLYFEHVNIIQCVLHRQTFERDVLDGLHRRDQAFGDVVLLVCAIAARYCDDPRVIFEGSTSWHSSGWKWYRQVRFETNPLFMLPTLHHIQAYALASIFLWASSASQAGWAMAGLGIRRALEVGAHRTKMYKNVPRFEEELWKRAFWSLWMDDRMHATWSGRPCALQEDDFDLKFPVECDDEYWVHPDPSQGFKQPSYRPSRVSCFLWQLKLCHIMGFAIRTLYSNSRAKIMFGLVGPKWKEHILSELDTALEKWIDTVPEHIRWDPRRENKTFLVQSAYLHGMYCETKILAHRPFLPLSNTATPYQLHSLSVCTEAARSCADVYAELHKRMPGQAFPFSQLDAFSSAIILLLNLSHARRTGDFIDVKKETERVQTCVHSLRIASKRWNPADRFLSLLEKLAALNDVKVDFTMPSTTVHDVPAFPSTFAAPSSTFPVPFTSSVSEHFNAPRPAIARPSGVVTAPKQPPHAEAVQPMPVPDMFRVEALSGSSKGVMGWEMGPASEATIGSQATYGDAAERGGSEGGTDSQTLMGDAWMNLPPGYGFDQWFPYVSGMVAGPIASDSTTIAMSTDGQGWGPEQAAYSEAMMQQYSYPT
ncbi:fungal-specific transcription factor domain-containing protein [Amylostereum chailletii]|nr:fungal-specific transcription factor domain-containing protein [Amylostereum chailletii]